MRIILLGPPGSGKGTQGDLIGKKYGFPKISTGDLLRRAVLDRTPLGREAEVEMGRGELVKDELVIELVKERLLRPDCQKGCVLDGFPRNLAQARILETLDKDRAEIVIEIFVDENVLLERLAGRWACPKCGGIFNRNGLESAKEGICDACGSPLIQRQDDRPEVIHERFRVYRKQTEPLAAYYKAKGIFHRLEGGRGVEAVFEDIRRILDAEIAKGRGTEVQS